MQIKNNSLLILLAKDELVDGVSIKAYTKEVVEAK